MVKGDRRYAPKAGVQLAPVCDRMHLRSAQRRPKPGVAATQVVGISLSRLKPLDRVRLEIAEALSVTKGNRRIAGAAGWRSRNGKLKRHGTVEHYLPPDEQVDACAATALASPPCCRRAEHGGRQAGMCSSATAHLHHMRRPADPSAQGLLQLLDLSLGVCLVAPPAKSPELARPVALTN
mmetsp:Transcript_35321/g.47696  ORF Transcript_35321/g.47696 Transcript_35321/m.47696 type:complete len:180 (-) Transcript_35321:84-623(-)